MRKGKSKHLPRRRGDTEKRLKLAKSEVAEPLANRGLIAETHAKLEWSGMQASKCFEILVGSQGEGSGIAVIARNLGCNPLPILGWTG